MICKALVFRFVWRQPCRDVGGFQSKVNVSVYLAREKTVHLLASVEIYCLLKPMVISVPLTPCKNCEKRLTKWSGFTVFTESVSASSRISKGQGYQGFIRKRAASSFGQKRVICIVQGKTWKMYRISLLLGSIKCFPISFNTFKTL
jgi:hypothetical protein